MRLAELRGVCRRRKPTTTQRQQRITTELDLVNRDFTATAPNQLWVADIGPRIGPAYVPTGSGFLYLAVVGPICGPIDVFSRRIVGWKGLILSPNGRPCSHRVGLEGPRHGCYSASAFRRCPSFHPTVGGWDQGCQYTSVAFGQRCREADVRPSLGSKGDCFDNASGCGSARCESFFASLECEQGRGPARLTVGASRPRPKHAWPCFVTLRGCTTLGGVTQHWDMPRRSITSKNIREQLHPLHHQVEKCPLNRGNSRQGGKAT